MEMRITIYLLTIWGSIYTAYGQFHCMIPGDDCENLGTCDPSTGTCTCEPGFEGHDCSLETATLCAEDVTNPCKNGGKCYNDDQCYCPYEYFGDKCESHKVTSDCKGTEMVIDIYVKDTFNGLVSMSQNVSEEQVKDGTLDIVDGNCLFTEEADPPPGMKKYKYTLPFDNSSPCVNASLVALENTPHAGDITYETNILQSFNTLFIAGSDRVVTVQCTHKSSNFSMFGELDAIDLNTKKDLRQKEKSETYKPLRFTVTYNNGSRAGPLNVGDEFKLFFWLADESVYKALMIQECIANDTSKNANRTIFKIIDKGCPVPDAKTIIQKRVGQTLTTYEPEDGVVLSAAELGLRAFKFRGTNSVGFKCKVTICKAGGEEACKPKCGKDAKKAASNGNDAATDAAATEEITADGSTVDVGAVVKRRKRDTFLMRYRRSTDNSEESFSTILTVVNPFELQQETSPSNQTPSNTDDKDKPEDERRCFRSNEIWVVIIAMSAFVFILLIACIVLSVTIIRTKNKLSKVDRDSEFSGPRFFIPRAKVNA